MARSWVISLVALSAAWLGAPVSGQEKPVEQEEDRIVLVLDEAKKIQMEFVRIKAGKFMMGSEAGDKNEKPVHEVTISKDFWMQTTETTQAQWEEVMDGKSRALEILEDRGPDLPMFFVSWEDCQEFLAELNQRISLRGKTAGLPTEAQWEYACRAGSQAKWCFGDDKEKLAQYAWCTIDKARFVEKVHPVGGKAPNSWGLFDMHGNVSEWCEDWYESYPPGAVIDPTGPLEDPSGKVKINYRVTRGGDFSDYRETRSARRRASNSSDLYLGFRVVLR